MARPALQIPLDLGARSAEGREDFLIAPCNEAAVALIDRWPDWPTPLLILSGPAASGKSHLAAVWREKTGAAVLKPDALLCSTAETIAQTGRHIVLDGVDPWLGDAAAETTLFHLYNILLAEKRSLLVTMRMAPAEIPFALPDLASRARAALHARIGAPDDALLSAVLVKLFHDRQLGVGADVIHYIVPRMERSFAAARALAVEIDRLSLARKRPAGLALAREALAGMQER